jgi:hypothetical protein
MWISAGLSRADLYRPDSIYSLITPQRKRFMALIGTRFVRDIGYFPPINPPDGSFMGVYCNPFGCQAGCIRIHCFRLAK